MAKLIGISDNEATVAKGAIADLQSRMGAEAYDALKSYQEGETMFFSGKSYRANQDVDAGETPVTHPGKWDDENKFNVTHDGNGNVTLSGELVAPAGARRTSADTNDPNELMRVSQANAKYAGLSYLSNAPEILMDANYNGRPTITDFPSIADGGLGSRGGAGAKKQYLGGLIVHDSIFNDISSQVINLYNPSTTPKAAAFDDGNYRFFWLHGRSIVFETAFYLYGRLSESSQVNNIIDIGVCQLHHNTISLRFQSDDEASANVDIYPVTRTNTLYLDTPTGLTVGAKLATITNDYDVYVMRVVTNPSGTSIKLYRSTDLTTPIVNYNSSLGCSQVIAPFYRLEKNPLNGSVMTLGLGILKYKAIRQTI